MVSWTQENQDAHRRALGAKSKELGLKGGEKTIADQIQVLIEKEEYSLCFALLTEYQQKIKPAFAMPLICRKRIDELKSNRMPFLMLENSRGIVQYCFTQLSQGEAAAMLGKFLRNLINNPEISRNEITECFDEIQRRLAWKDTSNLCHIEQEPLFREVVQVLEEARVKFGQGSDPFFGSWKNQFLALFLFDPEHLTSPDVYASRVSGLHHWPDQVPKPFHIDTSKATGVVIPHGPHVVDQSSGITMGVYKFQGTHAESQSAVHAKKFSTFWPSHVKVEHSVRGGAEILARNPTPIVASPGSDLYFGSFQGPQGERLSAYLFVHNSDPQGIRRIGTIFPAQVEERSYNGPEKKLDFRITRSKSNSDGSEVVEIGSPVKQSASSSSHVTPKRRMKSAIKDSGISPLRKGNRLELEKKIRQFFALPGNPFKLLPSNDDEILIHVSMRTARGSDLNALMGSALAQFKKGESRLDSPLKPDEITTILEDIDKGNPPVMQRWKKDDFYQFFRDALKK